MIRVAFYGRLGDLAWREPRALEVPGEVTTVAALRVWLPALEPRLTGELAPRTVRVVIGEAFAGEDSQLHNAADIAFLPPASGG